jgi:hypothetical protein
MHALLRTTAKSPDSLLLFWKIRSSIGPSISCCPIMVEDDFALGIFLLSPFDSDSRNFCIRSKHPVDIPTIGNDRRKLNAGAVSRDMIAREENVLPAVSESLPSYDDLIAKITKQDKGPSVGGKNAGSVSEAD